MMARLALLPLVLLSSLYGLPQLAEGQTTSENVLVDLRPCIIAGGTIEQDVVGVTEAHLFQEFFKGFWSSTQYAIIEPGSDETLDLTVGDDHARCNIVLVGTPMSSAQMAQLTAYSQKYQVRIVYFDEALTADDVTVMSRLGFSQYFAEPLVDIPHVKLSEEASPRVVNPSLQTDPLTYNIFTRPVIQVGSAANGTVTIVAEYADESGTPLAATDDFGTYRSVAACTYQGDGGEEEMHVYFAMAWFEPGSWAWAHYIAEWGTRGIFAGERRFWLGAMVDDLFLETNVFEFSEDASTVVPFDGVGAFDHEGELVRMSGQDMYDLLSATSALNEEYNAELTSEFPFNTYGILSKVESEYVFGFEDADGALLPKGDLPTENSDGTVGMDSMIDTDWWSAATVAGLELEFETGLWASDDLLEATMELKGDFFWQSHTLAHLARDDLSESDCNTEDGGNAQIAVIIGLFESDNYDWRSMTTPGITGLFNKNCLNSAANNLILCAPGDNTFDGVQTDVSLVSSVSQFHSIYTTEEVGFEGFQIVPRFASFVYFNCVTTDCLVLENLYIRRVTCECDNVNPGTIDDLNLDTDGCDLEDACPFGLQALETVDNIFETEATTAARWLMTGRRDKYMFHQANVIPTTVPSGDNKSLLEYWYEVVLAKLATYLNLQGSSPFPLQSVKFDDLCTNFGHHEDLDESEAVVTMTVTPAGGIAGMSLEASGSAGVIPVTVPTSFVDSVDTTGLPSGQPYKQEAYGSDTTFYIATSSDDEPVEVTKPSPSDLATPPGGISPTGTPAPSPTSPSPATASPAPFTPSPSTTDGSTPSPSTTDGSTPSPVEGTVPPTPGPSTPGVVCPWDYNVVCTLSSPEGDCLEYGCELNTEEDSDEDSDAGSKDEDSEDKDEDSEDKDEDSEDKDEDSEDKDEDSEEKDEDSEEKDEDSEDKDEDSEDKDEDSEDKDEDSEDKDEDSDEGGKDKGKDEEEEEKEADRHRGKKHNGRKGKKGNGHKGKKHGGHRGKRRRW